MAEITPDQLLPETTVTAERIGGVPPRPDPQVTLVEDEDPDEIDIYKIPAILGTYEPIEGTFPKDNFVLKPKFIVKVGGIEWPLIHGTIEILGIALTGNFSFESEYSVVGQTDSIYKITEGSPLDKLLRTPAAPDGTISRKPVIVYGGFSEKENPTTDDLKWLFSGFIDRVVINTKTNLVSITGRDPSVAFVETYTHEQFRNRTTASIVAQIASELGFDSYIVDRHTPVGEIYDTEQINMESLGAQGVSNWELLRKLAAYEGFRVFCIGPKLYYMPFYRVEKYLRFTLGENLIDLDVEKNFSVSAGRVSIEVASTDIKKKSSVIARSGVKVSDSNGKDVAQYRFVDATNTNPVDVGARADYAALQNAQMEYVVTVHTTGYHRQFPFNGLELMGTGSVYDRRYIITRLQWDFGFEQGWKSEITGISLPPGAQIIQAAKKTTHGLRKASTKGVGFGKN